MDALLAVGDTGRFLVSTSEEIEFVSQVREELCCCNQQQQSNVAVFLIRNQTLMSLLQDLHLPNHVVFLPMV